MLSVFSLIKKTLIRCSIRLTYITMHRVLKKHFHYKIQMRIHLNPLETGNFDDKFYGHLFMTDLIN